jgi:hypothetical protein
MTPVTKQEKIETLIALIENVASDADLNKKARYYFKDILLQFYLFSGADENEKVEKFSEFKKRFLGHYKKYVQKLTKLFDKSFTEKQIDSFLDYYGSGTAKIYSKLQDDNMETKPERQFLNELAKPYHQKLEEIQKTRPKGG